ncbi:DUF3800 domain-containing protein [Mesorhizobium sp. CO1-1-7]|uniref:DUF3800 domain-containing protein n=1 Tax=unclassified Mesorhizobium TaxID=325217 RepID=UPI00112CC817|nr:MULTISPECIES: DUF3800 domain-containing protein [unclassified Mesorhizobium]MBZ9748207.1 DUF3800 domain-containing protein [Mesorhizobium sp. CO1-1-7]TPL99485.1 DUF3800 domain-containing protein [Mesorhizobium sp. B2-3-10]
MHFIYIDDSSERPTHIFSAIAVPVSRWNETFLGLKQWRTHLRTTHGISTTYELHANQFLSGRGSLGTLNTISRHKRAQIFHTSFAVTEWLLGFDARVFNVCLNNDRQDWAFERLLNRINRTMHSWGSYAHLICDEGKEEHYTKMVRRMRVFNPIPSNRGIWDDTGALTRNITLDRIIEDPQFKSSARSYFIQQCDFVAYGLLRKERPTPKTKRYGIHKSFEQLDGTLVRECNLRDPHGIIR